MSTITLKNITKRYSQETVVHGIDLSIEEGEFVVLLGPSGCGKSTTLRMVAGLENISEGDLLMDGVRINEHAPKDRQVAMVFQNYALYPHMSVRQNMTFALKPLSLEKKEVEQRIDKVSDILGLKELISRKPSQLSGGQRQRVAMARAMVRTPKIFLFDEPLSNLDAKLRTKIRWEIGKLHKKIDTTILYVTHDQVEAMTLASKIVIMRNGYIEQVGTPEEVFNRPRNMFVAGFIGSPAMNMLTANIRAEKLLTSLFEIPIPKNMVARGKNIVAGIRPSDVSLVESKEKTSVLARISASEYLGNSILLDLILEDKQTLIAEIPAKLKPKGKEVFITPRLDAIHLFDADTGVSLIDD